MMDSLFFIPERPLEEYSGRLLHIFEPLSKTSLQFKSDHYCGLGIGKCIMVVYEVIATSLRSDVKLMTR